MKGVNKMRNFKRIAAAAISATMLFSTMSFNAYAAVMSVADATAATATDIADSDLVKATLEASAAKVAPGGTFELVFKVAGQNDPAAALNVGSLLSEIKYDVNSFDLACAIAEDNAYTDEGRKSVPFALYDALCTVNAADSKIVLGDVAPFKVIPSSDFAVFTVTVKEGTPDGQYKFIVPYVAATTVAGKALAYETPYEIIVEVSKDAGSSTPTETPSETPTETPSETPTETPSETPTETPSETPSETPTEAPTEAPVEDSIKIGSVTVKEGKTFSVPVTRVVTDAAAKVVVTVAKGDTVLATETVDMAAGVKKASAKFAALSAVKDDVLTIKAVYSTVVEEVETEVDTDEITVKVKKASSGGGGTSATTPVLGTTTPSTSVTEAPEATEVPEATEEPTVDAPSTDVVVDPSGVATGFADVAELTPWAAADINALAAAGIVNGVSATEFNPTANVTREQFVKMIVGALGLDIIDTTVTFNDVDAKAYYAPYVATAVQNGIVKGVSDEWFGVGENITREDMATIIYRALGLTGTNLPAFADAADIAGYAQPAVAELATLGVITGYEDGTFAPKANATRAEAAVVINRVLTIVSADAEEEVVEETTEEVVEETTEATEEVVAE